MKREDIQPNLIIYLGMLNPVSHIGGLTLPQSIVQQMPDSFRLDRRIQNASIDISFVNGMSIQAIELFRQTSMEFTNELTYLCVLHACSYSELVDEGHSIFGNMRVKIERLYTTMIYCLIRASFFEEAQQPVDQFEHDHLPLLPMHSPYLSNS